MSKITLAHGSGGRLTQELIENIFFKHLGNKFLNKNDDSAILPKEVANIAFTTDSFVIKPFFFPGGDIGKLSICGTVNDLAVNGATPKYIGCGFILEEGLDMEDLVKIVESMAHWAKVAGVDIVCGDTKVVEKNSADSIFINTSGIGFLRDGLDLGIGNISVGDRIIVTGNIADHGIALLSKREVFDFESESLSDCAPLNHMLTALTDSVKGIRFMRDATRGGVATTLNEIAKHNNFGIMVEEERVPVSDSARSACELLGLDPMYIANEGKVLIVIDKKSEARALAVLRNNEYGKNAASIGEITQDNPNMVCLRTPLGTTRILGMLTSDPIPRIC